MDTNAQKLMRYDIVTDHKVPVTKEWVTGVCDTMNKLGEIRDIQRMLVDQDIFMRLTASDFYDVVQFIRGRVEKSAPVA